MGHVYVTAAGYDKRVVPATVPCEFAIEPTGELRVTATASTPIAVRRISQEAALDPSGHSDPVADIIEGPAKREWWLDAGAYAVPLPRGWTDVVSGDVTPAFDLVKSPDQTVFLQTARNRPLIEDLVAVGQTVVARGADELAEWVELSYEHEGQRWLQRHALMRASRPTMVTAQAPTHAFDETRAVQMSLVHSLVFGA